MLFGEVRIIYPDNREETLQLTKAIVRLGRSVDGNDIVLVDSQVSRRHAELLCSRQGIQVMDLGSGNGVWLDGVRLTPHIPVALADESTFAIGRVRFVLRTLAPSSTQPVDGGNTKLKPASMLPSTNMLKPTAAGDQSALSPTGPPPESEAMASAVADPPEPSDAEEPGVAIPPDEPAPVLSPVASPSTPVVVTVQQLQIPTNVDPVDVDIDAGEAKTFVVTVINRTERVDAAVLHVEGVPQEWVTIRPIAVTNDQGVRNDRPTPTTAGGVSLLPGYIGELHAIICPPRVSSSRAGDYTCIFHTALTEQPQVTDQVETTITVKPFISVLSNLIPEHQSSRLRGRYQLEVNNQGNSPVDIDLSARDREDALRFDFRPKQPTIQEGAQAIVQMHARPRGRQLFGKPHSYPFTITSSPAGVVGQARQHQGELVLRWLPLWLIILLMALAIIALLLQPIIDLFKPVEAFRIERGPITEPLVATGRVAPPEIVTFAFERDGVIEGILPAGTKVVSGTELAHLRYYEQLRAIRVAEDTLKQAQLQLDLARKQHQNTVDAAALELKKAKAAAKRLAAGGADDPARQIQRTLDAAKRDLTTASADASIVKLKAEDQVAQATIAVQEAQQKLARAQWEWAYVQEHHSDPNFVPEVSNSSDASGVDTGSSETEAPELNDVQKQAFKDALNTATRAVSETVGLLTAAQHDLDRARAVEITANDSASAGVQAAQDQLTAIKKGQQTPEQVAAQNATDAAQLKLDSLSEPDLTAQLKAVADAEHALADERDKLALSMIMATTDGKVLSSSAITGTVVKAQAPMLQLARSDPNQVEVTLTDAQFQHITATQLVSITIYSANSEYPLFGHRAGIRAAGSSATVPVSTTTTQPVALQALFAFAPAPNRLIAAGDLARIKGELVLVPDTFWVDPSKIRTVDGKSFIWLRRVTNLLIAKYPRDWRASVTIGVTSADQVEIVQIAKPNRPDLKLCEENTTPNGDLSNRDIPDDCWVIIDPPAQ